ncbi:MAG: hypothetical protein AB1610_07460 [Nitrospirota bacterium]
MNTKSIAIICATLILIGLLFWPTLYRYDKMTLQGNTFPVRTHRLTGYTEYFLMGKWIPQKGQERSKKSEILSVEEQNKVTGNAGLSGYGSFSGKIYNGSSWTITDMIIRVIAKEKNGNVRWDRKFKETQIISPLSTASIYIAVTGDENVASFTWGIEEIRGYKKE